MEPRDRTHLADAPDDRVVDLDHLTVGHDLRVVERRLAAAAELERQIVLREHRRLELGVRPRAELLPQEVLPLLGVLRGPEERCVREALVVERVREAGRAQERMGLVRLLWRETHPPAITGTDAERVSARRHPAAGRGGRIGGRSTGGRGTLRELHVVDAEVVGGDEALHQRRVDPLAPAGSLARDQRGERSAHREVRRTGARDHVGREHGIGADAEHPAAVQPDLGCDDCFVALEPRVPAGTAERGDRADDQRGVLLAESRVVEAPLLDP